jgi:hypothetical protein
MSEATSNAVMDSVDHHQSQSIFSKMKNQKWWNQNQGWKNKYIDYDTDIKNGIKPRRVKWTFGPITMNKPVQLTDSWHFFKMLTIVCYVLASVTLPSFWLVIDNFVWYHILLFFSYLGILGIIRNKTFTLFYHKIFLL